MTTTTEEQITRTVYMNLSTESLMLIEATMYRYEEQLKNFTYPVLVLTEKIVSATVELKTNKTEQLYKDLDKANKELKTVMQARANIQAALDGCNLLRTDRIAQDNLLRGL